MIRLRQIEVSVTNSEDELIKKCSKKLNIDISKIKNIKINKKSIDARDKNKIMYCYEVDVLVENEEKILKKNKSNDIYKVSIEKYEFPIAINKKCEKRPIIVGSGPAGMFTAYMLAKSGYKPLILERGERVEDRIKSVERFWITGVLNQQSNVQFGEGGAGTFSDGKLNTLVKDKEFRNKKVLEIFVKAGAPKEILYLNKPHIGTDKLRTVVINLRNEIIKMGGEFRYNSCLTDIIIRNDRISSIEVNNEKKIDVDILVLAIGHSARDTFKMLENRKVEMEAKPFAVGLRIQHPQEMINISQYGKMHKNLENAPYKLTYRATNGRGVYSFCMCPGGFVVNASSKKKMLAINGMSNYERDSGNANSAIVVTVSTNDFGNKLFGGMEFQENLEKKAYEIGSGKIPIQLVGDFMKNKKSITFGKVEPIMKGNYEFSNIQEILPDYIGVPIKEAILNFEKKINGFAREDAILAAIETRTSSPIRILRNKNGESSIKGIYPAGEGAGYAGGIMSAAIDGIKVAENIVTIRE